MSREGYLLVTEASFQARHPEKQLAAEVQVTAFSLSGCVPSL